MLDPNFNPAIRVRGLHNRFGAQIVHDGLDMEVQQHEIFGVVGGSGTGKSVLLRSILGLRHPTAAASKSTAKTSKSSPPPTASAWCKVMA